MMIKCRAYCFTLSLILLVFTLNAQEQNASSELNELKTAYINFKQGNYSDAYRYFKKMLEMYPKDPTYNYYTGICFLHIDNNPDKALGALRYASTQDVPDDVYFYLGLAYHRNYQFNEALKSYLWFQERATKKQVNDYAIENYISMAQNGLYLIKYGKNFSVYSRDNIAKDEFYKQYQFNDLDGKFIDRDIFFDWEKDSLSENTILFVPHELERNEVLYFAAKHNTRDDYDIYRITKLSDTTWSDPVNLGEVINTPFDENYPFIHSDGSTLYFASKGHYSMGGYDVYKSSWDWGRQIWSEPENLGFPINSPFDDILFVPSANNKLAMMSSNRNSKKNEYIVYKFDPGYSSYIELSSHEMIKQMADMKVNASLDSREVDQSKLTKSKKTASFIQPSLEKDFLYKSEYDSLMNLALTYQLRADSLRWVIDDKRKQFDDTPDGQSRAKLSNQIIALEQQVYLNQKSADKCYQRVREIEQQNMASKNITYGFLGEDHRDKEIVQSDQRNTKKERQNPDVAFETDSLRKIQFYAEAAGQEKNQSNVFGFSINAPSRYTAANPIPVNEKLSDGIVYMIQLGAFSSSKNPAVFKGLEPLSAIKKPNSNIRKYYAGKFRTIREAEKKLPQVKDKGFSDAYIVAFYNGQIIPINQAVKSEAQNPELNYTAPGKAQAKEDKAESADNLTIIYTVNLILTDEDSVFIDKIKTLVPETKDLYLEKQNNRQKITIKSFTNYDEAFALKDKIESIMNKEVEVYAYFAEHQIPLDQAKKITQ
ncbi:MAG TPA: hypothetical protein VK982_10075 [Bacteroidales bacterium]|nr:hypothetical protein [Bacteroidales bacterium]